MMHRIYTYDPKMFNHIPDGKIPDSFIVMGAVTSAGLKMRLKLGKNIFI